MHATFVVLLSLIVLSTSRYVMLNNTGSVCYIISAEYQTGSSGTKGDLFAAAMGYNIAGFHYPWAAVGYLSASTNLNLDSYKNKPDQVVVDAKASVLAWSFGAIGEFCDMDSNPGFQNGTTDYIISVFDANLGTFTQSCGSFTEPQTGKEAYFSTVTANVGVFSTSCLVFPSGTGGNQYSGRAASAYDYKCDVRINFTSLWFPITACPDANRKIGLLLNVAGSSYDFDYRNATVLNSAKAFAPDANSMTFNQGVLSFKWDNYFVTPSTPGGTTGTKGGVVVNYMGTSTASYEGASSVHQFIFSFDKAKSSGNSEYYWDPTITSADMSTTQPTLSGSSVVASTAMLVMILIAYFI